MCSPILRCDWCLGAGISRRRRRRSCSLFHTPTTAIMHTCVRYRPGSGASKVGHKLSKLRKGSGAFVSPSFFYILPVLDKEYRYVSIIFTFRCDDRKPQQTRNAIFNHHIYTGTGTLDYRREYMSRNVGCNDQIYTTKRHI